MARQATPPYRFGDLLALARVDWIRQLSTQLAARGHPDYRRTDAASLRRLLRGAVPIGGLGTELGATRQAARKVVRGLEERGYATTNVDPQDARKINVTLTEAGRSYAHDVVAVIDRLNRDVAARVGSAQLLAADTVLRAAISNDQARWYAATIPPPPQR